MTNNSILAQQYVTGLRRINISLPVELVQELLDLLSELKDASKVRCTEDGQQYSVLDFIGNVVGKGSRREVWKRLQGEYPDTVTFCDSVKLPRSDNKKANIDSPVTTEFGMLLIAYILPGELGDRLRRASANLVLESVSSLKGNLQALFDQEPKVSVEIEQLHQRIAELQGENIALQIKLDEATENHLAFSYSLDYLHQVSRIVNKSQVKGAVTRDFLEGRDFVYVGDRVFLNESTFNILVLSFRSLRGTDVSQLPETIRITTRVYFQYQELKKKNRRVAQPDCSGQLALF